MGERRRRRKEGSQVRISKREEALGSDDGWILKGNSKGVQKSLQVLCGRGWEMGGISLSSFLAERLVLAQEEFSFGSVGVDFIVTGHSVFEIRAERATWET